MLQIMASDGGDPSRSGVLEVQINVLDVNDNSPRFDNVSMETNLMENSPPQTMVFQLQATDRDSGANGDVIYALREQGARACVGLFDVSNVTGVVRVKGQVDYEAVTRCTLTAMARDRGHSPAQQPAEIMLTVNIIDENDNAPTVSINTLTSQDTSSAEVPEDAEVSLITN